VTTEDSDYQRAFCEEFSRRDRVSVLVVQGESRRPVTCFQSALGQSRPAQLFRSPMKDFDQRFGSVVRWATRFELCLKVSQFLLKSHGQAAPASNIAIGVLVVVTFAAASPAASNNRWNSTRLRSRPEDMTIMVAS
jgi:hypothetical protein